MRTFLSLLSIGVLFVGPAAAQKVIDEDYFGTWIAERDAPGSCITEGEGQHFTVHRNYFEPGDGAACTEVKTWLRGDRLRISANCEGEEYGFRATARELRLISPNRIGAAVPGQKREDRYVLCVMPKQVLRQAHLDKLRNVADALAALNKRAEEEYEAKGPTGGQLTEAVKEAQERKIISDGGFSSRNQYDQIHFLVTDIMQSLDDAHYIERRHERGNLELVRANKTALAWIVATKE